MRRLVVSCAFAAAIAAFLIPLPASAFCGFYISGADGKLFNDATQVVLMREGTRTVLSMQNSYKGPPQSFAMVVPVPVVLQKDNVKTLPKDIFARVDQMTAPRLVEYWEQDPCMQGAASGGGGPRRRMSAKAPSGAPADEKSKDLGVTVEAQFTVGEYEIVILSALDAAGLDTWLRRENYKIPEGAEPYLRPYVQAGSKFFVAKVDVTKVTFENGVATLSPLRFHYDTETFSLPVRLGLMNSQGTQDLIVNVFAKGQRYEVANYPNTTIPTNFDVAEPARNQFGTFYASLFDRTLEKIPKAVVTEYSWDASSCDPCPSPPLNPGELATLGADVLPSTLGAADAASPPGAPIPSRGRGRRWMPSGFVVTRMHARYTKDALGEDLVFRAAAPIVGGREFMGENGKLEHGARSSTVNNFQGRYAIRHTWAGPIACKDPHRNVWGGPPNGSEPKPMPATNTAFAPRGKLQLATFVKGTLPDVVPLPGAPTPLGSPVVQVPPTPPGASSVSPSVQDASIAATDAAAPNGSVPPAPAPASHACGCDVPGTTSPLGTIGALSGIALALAALRRRWAKARG